MIPTLKGKDTSVAMLQDTHLSSDAATELRCLWARAEAASHAAVLGWGGTRTHSTEQLCTQGWGEQCRRSLLPVEVSRSRDVSWHKEAGYHSWGGTGCPGKAKSLHTGDFVAHAVCQSSSRARIYWVFWDGPRSTAGTLVQCTALWPEGCQSCVLCPCLPRTSLLI